MELYCVQNECIYRTEHRFVQSIGKQIATLEQRKTELCFVPRVYFHMCISTCVLPRVYLHETCTLHGMSKCGPRKHLTGMQCSILVVPHVITRVKMKL